MAPPSPGPSPPLHTAAGLTFSVSGLQSMRGSPEQQIALILLPSLLDSEFHRAFEIQWALWACGQAKHMYESVAYLLINCGRSSK